jgi:hypothetical protein
VELGRRGARERAGWGLEAGSGAGLPAGEQGGHQAPKTRADASKLPCSSLVDSHLEVKNLVHQIMRVVGRIPNEMTI